MPQATRALDFTSTFAINTHFDQAGQYDDMAKGIASLDYLGVRIIRLGVPSSANDIAEADQLAKAGVRFDLIVHPEASPQANVTAIHNFVASHPGSVLSIEGPNEVDLWPVSYAGLSGVDAAKAYQTDLFNAVNADPLLRDLPVYNFSWGVGAPDKSGAADNGTVHAYMPRGDQPVADITWWLNAQAGAMPGKPLVITETGYYTAPQVDPNWGGVDEATQAKEILNTFFRADALGVQRTFIYQLLDQYQDAAGTNREAHFGLFDTNFNAKPSATALHNLTTILADTGATAGSFTPGALNYTVSGLPSSGGTKLLEKANGTYDLAVWAEPDIWDENAHQAIAAPTSQVVVKLGATYSTVQVFDPMKGTAAQQVLHDVQQLTVGVTDHPLIIELSNGTTQTTVPVTTTALTVGSGSDSLVLKVSQDAYQGSAQYTVAVDGQQIGGTLTATALASAGLSDTVTVKGDWAAGAHAVTVTFLNDLYGGTADTDRNLHVDGASYNGTAVTGATLWLGDSGPAGFGFTEAAPLANRITGTASADSVDGSAGADSITGSGGNDTLRAADGDDTIDGGSGTDRINGGNGNDCIIGGSGADIVAGGAGADMFVFNSASERGDTILDFSASAGDRLDLRPLFAAGPHTQAELLSGGYVKFVQGQTGATIMVDLDGHADAWSSLVTLKGLVNVAQAGAILIA